MCCYGTATIPSSNPLPSSSLQVTSGYLMRRTAVDFGTSLLTNIKCAVLFCDALSRNKALPCLSAQEYVNRPPSIGW